MKTKHCKQCNSQFIKRSEESYKYFDLKQFCSNKCRTNNRIGTKTGKDNPFFGKTHTQDVIQKGIQANLGKKVSLETRKKMSIAQTGEKNHFYGKKHKLETIAKFSGANCNFWKGGITPINTTIRNSYKYLNWRKQIFERDDYTCQECDKRGGILQVDHIKPFAYFPELRFDINNGRVLCLNCHKKTETYGAKVKQIYG